MTQVVRDYESNIEADEHVTVEIGHDGCSSECRVAMFYDWVSLRTGMIPAIFYLPLTRLSRTVTGLNMPISLCDRVIGFYPFKLGFKKTVF